MSCSIADIADHYAGPLFIDIDLAKFDQDFLFSGRNVSGLTDSSTQPLAAIHLEVESLPDDYAARAIRNVTSAR